MPTPSSPRADAAYERARAAYEEKSYDLARRCALEALAHDPQHAGARALLSRLDAARRGSGAFQSVPTGPEVVSTDPTVLISRASRPSAAEPIEPTVMIQRDEPWRRMTDTDTGSRPVTPAPKYPPSRPAADPTVIGTASRERTPSSRPKSSFSLGAMFLAIGQAFPGPGNRAASSTRRPAGASRARSDAGGRAGGMTPTSRGALIAVGVVAIAALFVWGLFLASGWIWPKGQTLTLTKPVGGTIVGPGLNCGTGGSDCSRDLPTDEPVELEARADPDHVFSGFTGDCAPTGRTAMSEPRTCGATFDPVASAPAALTFRLTITKPTGGTIIGAGGILCGSLDSICSAEIPSGAPVTLRFQADSGYTFSQFTGECPANGEMTMTSAKTCGATFTPTSTPVPNVVPSAGPPSRPRPRPRAETQATAPPAAVPAPQPPSAPSPPTTSGTGVQATPTNPDKPAAPPITAEAHARDEIQKLVKSYCVAYESLKSGEIKELFPLVNERVLRDQFREYKSLKCTITSELEYDRLDAGPAGGAQVKFGMKQVMEMKSGGAPKTKETNVTLVVSRMNLRSAFRIDQALFVEKPPS